MNGVKAVSAIKVKGSPLLYAADKILTKKGVFRCEKLADSFYRGSEATTKEFPLLAEKGIKRVISLKTIDKKEASMLHEEAAKCGIEFKNIPINPFKLKKYMPELIKEIKDPTAKFVHCTYGVDRTGFVSALHRYINEGVPMFKAFAEMKNHGFNTLHRMTFFNLERYLRQFANKNPIN